MKVLIRDGFRRAKNKALGLAGHAEILIGHLYSLIQSWSNFWVAIVENCTENGQWPAAILSSASMQASSTPSLLCTLPVQDLYIEIHRGIGIRDMEV